MVSFIIRTLNEGQTLGEVIRRIKLLEDKYEKEIIVVDSGSQDDTLKIAQENGCKIFNIKKEQFSWGRSLNLGIQNSQGEFIVIISAHCFITKKDFLIRAVEFINKNDLAAAYGQQRAVPQVDPFEEIELKQWFPNKDSYIMDEKCIKSGRNIGISNACSIIKKSVWSKYKFDEDVQSLEDFIWAADITRKGMLIGYSSSFGVYHSHKYNVENIYKRWFARTYESLKYQEKFYKYNLLKMIIKKYFYKQYLAISRKRKLKVKKELLNDMYRNLVTDRMLYEYQMIIDTAMANATYSFFNNNKISYSNIKTPSDLVSKIRELNKISSHLKDLMSALELIISNDELNGFNQEF